jgi:hypothetical protein
VAEYLAAHPGTQAVRVRTARELRLSVARAHELKHAEMAGKRVVDLRQLAGVAMDSRWSERDPRFQRTAQEPARLQRGVN